MFRELLAERERVVLAEANRTGVYNPHAPQYMDGRLGIIDEETVNIETKIQLLENQIQNMEQENDSSSWDNATNIISSADRVELEIISQKFMNEIIDRRLMQMDLEIKLLNKDQQICELRSALEKYTSQPAGNTQPVVNPLPVINIPHNEIPPSNLSSPHQETQHQEHQSQNVHKNIEEMIQKAIFENPISSPVQEPSSITMEEMHDSIKRTRY